MSKEFRDVAEFNAKVIRLTQTNSLNDERLAWFKRVINEELGEFEVANLRMQAVENCGREPESKQDDFLETQADMADAIIDLIYFAYGRLIEIGITEEDFDCMWDAIQKANMSKKRGNKGRGSDVDAIKPQGWQGPEETFIKFKKARMAKLATPTKDINKQLDSNMLTPYDKNIVAKLNDLNCLKSSQSYENDNKNNYIATEKGRSSTLDNYYSNDCTIPSKPLHVSGQKYDEGKPNLSLVFGGFSKALLDVGQVGTFGARKYTASGWKSVPNLEDRYMSALLRHTFAVLRGELFDKETGRHHLAHAAWNALAILENTFNTSLNYEAYNKTALTISEATLHAHFED